jgi:tetratricopeptide (TPR) repeat protein
MAEHGEVFISATTRELRGYRGETKNALLTLKIFPIEQSNFELAHGPLTKVLHDLIDRCDAVIHLAGFYYGAEPPQRPIGKPRRSYTQIEYDVARELGKPIYLFLATKDCKTDETLAQTDEEKSLQMAHRQRIQTCGDIYYSFTSREELASQVLKLPLRASSAAAIRRVSNLPYNSLGPLFKGRVGTLVELKERFRTTDCQAIHGLGGVGKTRLAIEYAWRHAGDYSALLSVGARSPADFRSNLAALCNPEILKLSERDRTEETERLAAVFRWLSENPGWLLILDSADTIQAAAEVEKTLPKLLGGDVIITSRIADWSLAVQPVELDVLAHEDAAAFLLARTELQRKKTPTDTEDAPILARELGGLALAMEQAGAYIAKNRFSFSEYLQRWETTREKVLAWYDPRLMQYPSSVATTWQASVDQLALPERLLLNILAWFSPEPTPKSLLEGVTVDGTDAREALSGLISCSLVRWNADGDNFTIHRLVQEITRERLPDDQKHDTLDLALAILNGGVPAPEWDQKGWRLWEQLAPHCRTLLNRLQDHVLEPKATRIMYDLAVWLNNRAKHDEAEPLLRRALTIYENSFGPEHPNVASGLNNLASVFSATNRLADAEPLYRHALTIYERTLGPEHSEVATALNNLAGLLHATNRLAEAEPLYRRALEIDEKSFGPEHPDVARSLNNLAGLLRATNRLAEAEPLYRRALEIMEKSFGAEHPDVAIRLNNLAGLLSATNRLAEAEPLYRRALEIDEKSVGPEHPNVAIRLNNLAGLLHATNRLAEAEPLYRRALKIDEKSFGPEHPNVAKVLINLASVFSATNRLAEAEPLYRRALKIHEKSFGPEHPNVAIGLNNLAELLGATNRLAEAEPLYRRALEIDEKSFGPEHPDVAIRLNNLAGLLHATNRLAEAEPLYRRALEIDEKSVGPEHPNVAIGLNNLAGLFSDINRLAEAEPLYRRALKIDEKSFGPEHPNVAIRLNNLAGLLGATNRPAEAEPLYRRALEIDQKSFGPEHPDVARILNNLAGLLRATNRLAEAEPLYRQVLRILSEFWHRTEHEHPHFRTAIDNYAALLTAKGLSQDAIAARALSAIEGEEST